MLNNIGGETSTMHRSEETPVVSAQLEKQIEKKKNQKRSKKTNPERGVLFIKNIPDGFFEDQMWKYFGQFGRVTRLRLVRTKRTGRNKGFAYVEFEYPEVAKEALKSLQDRLMFYKFVKVVYIPPEEQKFDYFKTGLRAVRKVVGKHKILSIIKRHPYEAAKAANYWVPENYFFRMCTDYDRVQKIKDAFTAFGLDPSRVPNKIEVAPREEIVRRFGPILGLSNEAMYKAVWGGEPVETENQSGDVSSLDIHNRENPPSSSPETGNILLIKKRQPSPRTELKVHNQENREPNKGLREKRSRHLPQPELEKPAKKKSKYSTTDEQVPKKIKEKVAERKFGKEKKVHKSSMSLKDLLENSLKTDDSDDEFIPQVGNEGDTTGSDNNSSSPSPKKDYQKLTRNYVQILKSDKMEKNKKILKRTGSSGSVQKKKHKKDKNTTKQELKISAAKELIKSNKPQISKKIKK